MGIIRDIIKDWIREITYYIETNLRGYANILNFLLPYIMYIIGQYIFNERGKYTVGGEIFIPVIVYMIIYFIKSYANKIGKGTDLPIPGKRFTAVDKDGEVSIEQSRVQELLLYTADLEDWMERKGFI